MALNLRRGFLRLWALGSTLWVGVTVALFWEQWRTYFNPPPVPEGFEEFAVANPPMNPILGDVLFAISAPAISFFLGLAVLWIYRGFTASKR